MRSARATNQPQQAMLRGLITDPHGRPMVPTYGSSKAKRYAYYETRKDLARPGDPPGIRFQRGQLEQHLLDHLEELLGNQHAMSRSGSSVSQPERHNYRQSGVKPGFRGQRIRHILARSCSPAKSLWLHAHLDVAPDLAELRHSAGTVRPRVKTGYHA